MKGLAIRTRKSIDIKVFIFQRVLVIGKGNYGHEEKIVYAAYIRSIANNSSG